MDQNGLLVAFSGSHKNKLKNTLRPNEQSVNCGKLCKSGQGQQKTSVKLAGNLLPEKLYKNEGCAEFVRLTKDCLRYTF